MRYLLALVVSCSLVAGGLAATASPALAYTPDNEELTFLALINDYRGLNGLAPLALNPTLGDAAEFHSQDMAENNYFAHTAPNGTTFSQNIDNFGYTGDVRGENIASGMEFATDALAVWQHSPEHNAGMLNPAFSEIGIGRYYSAGSTYGWYWTTTFGGGSASQQASEFDGDGERRRNRDRNNDGNGTTDTVVADPAVDVSDGSGDGLAADPLPDAPAVTNADGADVSATEGSGPVNGDGAVNVYDDINTGGVSGDSVDYDQTVTPPSTTTTPPPADTTAAAAPVEQAPPPAAETAPVEQTTVTTTDDNGTVTDTFTSNIQEGNGNVEERGNPSNANSSSTPGSVTTNTTDPAIVTGPEAAPAPAPDPATTTAPPASTAAVDPALAGTGCATYGTWYDAQVAYEGAGGTAADPALVNSLDPNWDGVACEELMTY